MKVSWGRGFISLWFTEMYFWACDFNHKISDQPVCERVTASSYFIFIEL